MVCDGFRDVLLFVETVFFAGAFLAGVFLAGVFLAGAFLAGAFFTGVFLAPADLVGVAFTAGLAAVFFADVALALGLLATGFFATDFLATLLAAALLAALCEADFFCEAAGRLDVLRRAPPTDFPFFGGIASRLFNSTGGTSAKQVSGEQQLLGILVVANSNFFTASSFSRHDRGRMTTNNEVNTESEDGRSKRTLR